MMKILIRNIRVIDPENGRDEIGDVAVERTRFAFPSGDLGRYDLILDGKGCLAFPGLIDFHMHLFDGGTDIGAAGDINLLPNGVTSAVDAGSAGISNYRAFSRGILTNSRLTLRAFLNVCPAGLATSFYHETLDRAYIDIPKLKETFETYRTELLGLKIRFSKEIVGEDGQDVLAAAIDAAEELRCPLVVHTTNAPISADRILAMLRPGDIYCHVFQGKGNTILTEKEEVCEAVFKAREKGILFDAASGRNHFSHRVARTAFQKEFYPDIISTDMTASTAYQYPVYSLPHMMSRCWNMGMPLYEVVKAVTSTPARAMGLEGLRGTMKPGAAADLAVFQAIDTPVSFYDFEGIPQEGSRLLVPQMTIKDGVIVYRQADFLNEIAK